MKRDPAARRRGRAAGRPVHPRAAQLPGTRRLLDVITDGNKAVDQISELRPDVVLVDSLLQGRIKGPKLVEPIHEAEARRSRSSC